jgi:hypothetical protein
MELSLQLDVVVEVEIPSFVSASIASAVDQELFEILPGACLGTETILTGLEIHSDDLGRRGCGTVEPGLRRMHNIYRCLNHRHLRAFLSCLVGELFSLQVCWSGVTAEYGEVHAVYKVEWKTMEATLILLPVVEFDHDI